MQFYKIVVDMSVPESSEIWSWMHPHKHEIMDRKLNGYAVNFTSEPLPNNAYRFTLWFNDEQTWRDYLVFRETVPEFQERTAHETLYGITRTIVSEGYVEVE